MNSTQTFRLNDQKCATCRWWGGAREMEFRAYKPFYVKTSSNPSVCFVKKQKITAINKCTAYEKWEKL